MYEKITFSLIIILLFCCIYRIISYKPIYNLIQITEYDQKTFPIDIVYTWVNTQDEYWAIKKNELMLINNPDTREDSLRFNFSGGTSDEELKLSIQLILKNCPWVRNIYVVTMRPQIPHCIYLSNKIKVIYHDQIFLDNECLPSFNSCAIEANIHRIPGLAEHFLYLNDDYYITKPVYPYHFFTEDGIPIQRTSILRERLGFILGFYYFQNLHDRGWEHYRKTVEKKYAVNKIWHHAIPLTKNIMSESEKYYEEEWKKVTCTAFRHENTIPPVGASVNYSLDNNLSYQVDNDQLVSYSCSRRILFSKEKCIDADLVCINYYDEELIQLITDNFLNI